MLVARTAGSLIAGDPKDRNHIHRPHDRSVKEAARLDGWIQEATRHWAARCCAAASAKARCWKRRCLKMCPARPARLQKKPSAHSRSSRASPTFEQAFAEVNDSKFGLQAGIFTRDVFKVLEAWDHLDVGGVVINDVPSYRVDNMPYGGVKDSGLGREGIRFAMEDMTEIRNLVIRRKPLALIRGLFCECGTDKV
jgi:hypothetical protein